jgi:hypothetical protein
MTARVAGSLSVVLLVLLAGCSGIVADVETESHGPNETEQVHDLPLDGETVLDTHESTVNDAGSFTYDLNTTVWNDSNGDIIQFRETEVRADLDSGEFFGTDQQMYRPYSETYLDGEGNAYQRKRNRTTVQHAAIDPSQVNVTSFARPPLRRYIDGLALEHQGTDTVDNVTVDTYRATTTEQVDPSEHGLAVISPDRLDSVNVTVQIDREGVVRTFDYRVVGENAQGDALRFHIRLGYSDVGSTNVTEPGWLENVSEE